MLPALESLLILQPGDVSWIMLTTPLLGVLRRTFPDARLDFAVPADHAPIIEANPLIDTRLHIEPRGARGWLHILSLVRGGQYDAVFVPHPSAAVSAAVRAGSKRGAILAGLSAGASGLFYSPRAAYLPNANRHIADQFLDLARAIHAPVHHAAVEFTPSAASRKQVLGLIDKHKLFDKPFILIHPGTDIAPHLPDPRRWLAPNFARLAMQLMRDTGIPVAFIGSSHDSELLSAISGLLNAPVILFGERPIGDIGALAERCTLYIGNDTGATHVAVGAGARVLMIMGPTRPTRCAPFGQPDKVTFVWREQPPKRNARFSWGDGAGVPQALSAAIQLLPPHPLHPPKRP